MKRILYLAAMFTGLRAVFNWGRSYLLPEIRLAILDGEILTFKEYGAVRIRVNARPAPKLLPPEARAGMISLYLMSPSIPRIFYAILRFTSHFGYGHVEIAFYEANDKITLFAVRNILRSNLDRLRLNSSFGNLKFSGDNDEIVVLNRVIDKLNSIGFTTTFAPPDECVSLALTPSLLAPSQRIPAKKALLRKYMRIERKLVSRRNITRTSAKQEVELTNHGDP